MNLLLSAVLLGVYVSAAQAWGVLGHATVAYVAQNFVKSTTATWAKGVLGDTSTSYLANIASWADTFRATTAGSFSAPFHFIDALDSPPTSCNVNFSRDCTKAGCSISGRHTSASVSASITKVLAAIQNYTQRVQDGRLSATNVNQALMFLVHFLGDITQPLHDENLDVGGNTINVVFQGFNDNLHADWDTFIPEQIAGGSSLTVAKAWAANITTAITSGMYASQAASWIAGDDITDAVGSATKWASDANTFVCSVVMPNGVAALQKGDLFPTYYNSVAPTVQLQLAKGGYRLANWLDQIADSNLGLTRRNELSEPRQAEDGSISERDLLLDLSELSAASVVRAAFGYDCGHAH
ncbi:unnamed protein product [Mycena citricolor]|uniref:Aspergillus nuclease S(1) n=1 Tax=Mycena citricolor TaxID=2018698 RepID=A0AAD2HEE9_9AGAR|nr:unnamed protein product [Mycena citricolor]